jgi:endonuclease YncB( thermonuclease family)
MPNNPRHTHTDPGRRRRRTFRTLAIALVALLALTSLSDRSGLFGFTGDDFARFNHRAFPVLDVLDGDTFRIRADNDHIVTVRLLGVDAPEPPSAHWSPEATRYLTARLKDRTITLRLDGTQPRDTQRHLLAYVFITDTDNLNADLIRDGQAYADRRVRHTFASTFEALETEARKHHRGLWRDITDDMQPTWRQEWLRALRQRRATS